MGFSVPFLLGLIGSFHCAGMCGPLALALPSPHAGRAGFLLSRLAYNLGRVITYCSLGLIAGVLGRTFLLAGLQRALSITAGVLLLVGLFSARRIALSGPLTTLVSRLKARMSVLLHQRSFLALTCLGLLNGLLPCGLAYVALAGAAATGHVLSAVAYMAAFGFGTLPTMLAISLSGRLLPFSVRLKLQRAIPVSIVLVGALLILRGLSLGIPYLSPNLAGGSCCHP